MKYYAICAGIVDSSGFRLYYTPKLRKFDAGTLMLGSTVSTRMIIPPKVKEYTVAGHSNPACLDPVGYFNYYLESLGQDYEIFYRLRIANSFLETLGDFRLCTYGFGWFVS